MSKETKQEKGSKPDVAVQLTAAEVVLREFARPQARRAGAQQQTGYHSLHIQQMMENGRGASL